MPTWKGVRAAVVDLLVRLDREIGEIPLRIADVQLQVVRVVHGVKQQFAAIHTPAGENQVAYLLKGYGISA